MKTCICCGKLMNVLTVPLHTMCQSQHYYWHLKGHDTKNCESPDTTPVKISRLA
jgi:hypothetical protein